MIMLQVTSPNRLYHAYTILRVGFSLLPIIAGLDKFFNGLTNWGMYLAPGIPAALGVSVLSFMYFVGVVEILAGILTALAPRVGAYIVAVWLLLVIINLLSLNNFYDIALRDFGLLLSVLALAKLAGAVATSDIS